MSDVAKKFNVSAGKIVKESEFEQNIEALSASELTKTESIICTAFNYSVGLLEAAVLAVMLEESKSLRDRLKESSGDNTLGLYEDVSSKDFYMHENTVRIIESRFSALDVFPGLSRKLQNISERALANCEDHRPKLNGGQIVPF